MSVLEQVQKDYIGAMREKNEAIKSVTQMLRAKFKNEEIDKKTALSEEDVLTLVRKELKQTEESLKDSQKAGRDCTEYEVQLAYLRSLLPAALSAEQIADAVQQAAQGLPSVNKGTLMKAAMAVLKGKADGKDISAAVDGYLAAM